jgi:microcystin-dependent protein
VAQIYLGADIVPTANISSNVGSAGMRFNTVHAQSASLTGTLAVGTTASVSGSIIIGGSGAVAGNLSTAGNLSSTSNRTSTSTTSGALVLTGGAGIAGNLHVGGTIVTATMPAGTSNTAVATTAFVQNNSVPTGGLMMWPTVSPPTGFLLCNGSAVSRTTYAALFAVLGSTFGSGDGINTFNLPDYRNRTAIGAGGLYAAGANGGSKDAVVVSHTHNLSGGSVSGTFVTAISTTRVTVDSAVEGAFATPINNVTTATASPTYASPTVQSAGSSGTDANLPPYLAIYYIIKT